MSDETKKYISPYDNFCNGYAGDSNQDKGYILGVSIGIGISESKFSHKGSNLLDEINAFDLAEVDGPYLGQLNMSIVSSFCGPQGLIWGYDIASNIENRERFTDIGVEQVSFEDETIDIYNGNFLVDSLKLLFGTVNQKNFNLMPGSHVPFASKNIKVNRPGTIYSAIAIGIPEDRKKNACLLMEDVGVCKIQRGEPNKKEIIIKLAESIIQIGKNQGVKFKETMIVFKSKKISKGQTACALVAAPYFTLAQNARPLNREGQRDFNILFSTELKDWSNNIRES